MCSILNCSNVQKVFQRIGHDKNIENLLKLSHTERFYKMVFTTSLLRAQHKKGQRGKQAGKLAGLFPWARHITGCLHLHAEDRWHNPKVYPLWWPSLTKDMQIEHELIRMSKSRHSTRIVGEVGDEKSAPPI